MIIAAKGYIEWLLYFWSGKVLAKKENSNPLAKKSENGVTFCPATTHILNVSKKYQNPKIADKRIRH